MSLSVIIASCNDVDITNTCRSIRETAPGYIELIVVDDCSATPVAAVMDPLLNVKLITNKVRCGCGASRTIGVHHATGEFIFLCDPHMRFPKGWYETAMKRIGARPTTIHCARCLDMDNNASYQGATLNICGPDRNKPGRWQVLEGVWMPGDTADDAELACIMGACYFMPRAWFLKLDALSHLRCWGQDEVQLAIKTWLAGGDCRYIKDIAIRHKFWAPGKIPYTIPTANLLWNKLFAMYTLCPPEVVKLLQEKLRFVPGMIATYEQAMASVKVDWREIAMEQARNKAIFKRDWWWYTKHFGLAIEA